jgi:hypothetical protein
VNTVQIFETFAANRCEACAGWKRKHVAFCHRCYGRLPRLLRSSLWKRFGSGFEEAYHACLSWFRINPQSDPTPRPAPRPAQTLLFRKENA